MASQLDKLGLCTTDLLTKLCDYRDRRDYWFEQIATHHDIPEVTSTGASRRDAVKALPIRLLGAPTPSGPKTTA